MSAWHGPHYICYVHLSTTNSILWLLLHLEQIAIIHICQTVFTPYNNETFDRNDLTTDDVISKQVLFVPTVCARFFTINIIHSQSVNIIIHILHLLIHIVDSLCPAQHHFTVHNHLT